LKPYPAAPYLISIATVAAIGLILMAGELIVRFMAPEQCARASAIKELAGNHLKLLEPCARRVVENGEERLHVVSTFGQENRLPFRKPPNTVRVAVVGESSGERLGDSLTDLTNDLQCASRYEVLNCARSAADLAMTARMFDEALGYEPDAVVVVFGHNIRYEYELDATQLRARQLVASSCVLASLLPEAQGSTELRMSGVDPKLAELEIFLRHAVEASRRRDVQLMLSTMAVNLWMPPRADGLIRNARGSEAMLLAEEGKVDAALASLAAIDGHEAERRFRAGVWLAQAGRADDAYAELQGAVDEDPGPDRRPAAVNTLIRSAARESSVLLRDTEAAVESRSPGGLPGWESFVDNCHLTPAGINIETREVFRMLRAPTDTCNPSGWQGPATRRNESSLARLLNGVLGSWGGGAFDQAVTYAIVTNYTANPSQTRATVEQAIARIESETQPRSDILVAIAEAWRQVDRSDEALRLNEMARRRDPGNINALHQAAILAWRSGNDTQARAFATETMRLDPADQLAPALLRRVGSAH
jgi:tetratricopeptide (TPR) repeat protein